MDWNPDEPAFSDKLFSDAENVVSQDVVWKVFTHTSSLWSSYPIISCSEIQMIPASSPRKRYRNFYKRNHLCSSWKMSNTFQRGFFTFKRTYYMLSPEVLRQSSAWEKWKLYSEVLGILNETLCFLIVAFLLTVNLSKWYFKEMIKLLIRLWKIHTVIIVSLLFNSCSTGNQINGPQNLLIQILPSGCSAFSYYLVLIRLNIPPVGFPLYSKCVYNILCNIKLVYISTYFHIENVLQCLQNWCRFVSDVYNELTSTMFLLYI